MSNPHGAPPLPSMLEPILWVSRHGGIVYTIAANLLSRKPTEYACTVSVRIHAEVD